MIAATWNVHEGRRDGVAIIMRKPLEAVAPDLIAFQEFPDKNGRQRLEKLGEALSLPHLAHWGFERFRGAGLAILSRWPLTDVRRELAEEPDISVESTGLSVHQKGALSTQVAHPEGVFTFVCLHLLPMHIFGYPDSHVEGRRVWQDLAARLRLRGERFVVAGDFNAPMSSRLAPSLLKSGARSTTGDASTRDDGRSHDDILTNFSILGHRIIRTRSDHHLCVAQLA